MAERDFRSALITLPFYLVPLPVFYSFVSRIWEFHFETKGDAALPDWVRTLVFLAGSFVPTAGMCRSCLPACWSRGCFIRGFWL